jgi:hypothetical protein
MRKVIQSMVPAVVLLPPFHQRDHSVPTKEHVSISACVCPEALLTRRQSRRADKRSPKGGAC